MSIPPCPLGLFGCWDLGQALSGRHGGGPAKQLDISYISFIEINTADLRSNKGYYRGVTTITK